MEKEKAPEILTRVVENGPQDGGWREARGDPRRRWLHREGAGARRAGAPSDPGQLRGEPAAGWPLTQGRVPGGVAAGVRSGGSCETAMSGDVHPQERVVCVLRHRISRRP